PLQLGRLSRLGPARVSGLDRRPGDVLRRAGGAARDEAHPVEAGMARRARTHGARLRLLGAPRAPRHRPRRRPGLDEGVRRRPRDDLPPRRPPAPTRREARGPPLAPSRSAAARERPARERARVNVLTPAALKLAPAPTDTPAKDPHRGGTRTKSARDRRGPRGPLLRLPARAGGDARRRVRGLALRRRALPLARPLGPPGRPRAAPLLLDEPDGERVLEGDRRARPHARRPA